MDEIIFVETETESEELDIIAFELWQRSCRHDPTASDDCSDDEEAVGCHASCL